MVKHKWISPLLLILVIFPVTAISAEQVGGIRGMVYDADFDVPLASAQVSIAETGVKTVASDQGNYVFNEVAAGTYTLVFSKDGYVRHVKSNVLVSSGNMTEIDASLSGDFTDMEEFVVQDMQIGSGTEAALLDLRLESPAMMDSVGSELMSRAGAGDAASALKLVSGASVQDGKYAVIRGLPDRYVSSQMNGVRLPTADSDKRAVQLDQFPASVIESIQVSKTFTPDQQGDASGGAVNIILKSIPEGPVVKLSSQYSWNTMVAGSDFQTHKGGGLNFWGKEERDIPYDGTTKSWGGAVGVCDGATPLDYKWSVAGGDKHTFENGMKLGGFGSFFYERDSSFYDDGIDDRYWVEQGSNSMTPEYSRGAPAGADEPFVTSLFDVTRASQKVQWGGLGVLGLEVEEHSKFSLLYMYTQDTEEKVTLAENTRGKASLHTYWPAVYGPEFDNYTAYDMSHPANQSEYAGASPYRRNQTLEYTERTTQTLQLSGRHTLPDLELGYNNIFMLHEPEVDWTIAESSARLYQPDKRLFSEVWVPKAGGTGKYSPFIPVPAPASYGDLQRIWKDINEDSGQYFTNLKLPFEQWSGDEGYMKFGLFHDKVKRQYNQDSFSNIGDGGSYNGTWEDGDWSTIFPAQNHPIQASNIDVDYEGEQLITAKYFMADVPLCSFFNVIGGVRYEETNLKIDLTEVDSGAFWRNPSAAGNPTAISENDKHKLFNQRDALPSIGFTFDPIKSVILRGSYTETVARQTFKELAPIEQREYLGADAFVGNPDLKMSALKNYDLRLDWTPYDGALVSVSWFKKNIMNPIEYTQYFDAYGGYTTAVNYPEGKINGYELETRQDMGHFWDRLEGISIGANATFIESEVTLPQDEADDLKDAGYPMPTRDMMNAPEHLYNFFTMYDIKETGTQLAIFYTVRGDTLVTGAGMSFSNGVHFMPDIYEKEYGTLNFSLSQKLGEIWTLGFQAKNLLDPAIDTVYRSEYIGGDVTKSSYNKGMDFSISLSATF